MTVNLSVLEELSHDIGHALQQRQGYWRDSLQACIAWSLPALAKRSLRQGLQGIWYKSATHLPNSGCIVAANHHSWWDAYLVWLFVREQNRPFSAMMDEAQLERFPFFRNHGIIGKREVREALRRLEQGHSFVIFPEGQLCPPGEVTALHPGVMFLAARARVPVYPLAVRLCLRGGQYPEAFLQLGRALELPSDPEAQLSHLQDSLNILLSDIDHDIARSDPEGIPEGNYSRWLRGQQSFHLRVAWLSSWLRSEPKPGS